VQCDPASECARICFGAIGWPRRSCSHSGHPQRDHHESRPLSGSLHPPQPLVLRGLVAGDPLTLTRGHPPAQALAPAALLLGNGLDGLRIRGVIGTMLTHGPDDSLLEHEVDLLRHHAILPTRKDATSSLRRLTAARLRCEFAQRGVTTISLTTTPSCCSSSPHKENPPVSFQTPRSVEEMLTSIHRHEYLMPAIQREFVWSADQIAKLVDSLMRGYPVGSFLLWNVEPKTARSYTFYEFLANYHERDNPYADKATLPARSGITAVLDGQQRLTALNIALCGSYAEKRKYAWWSSTDAFLVKRLYLNLVDDPNEAELGLKYDLRFLTEREAAASGDHQDKWIRVGAVLDLADSGPAIMKELERRNITAAGDAFQRLFDLYQAVRMFKPMNYFLVTDQDPDKVLEIFVRVNSGGTVLSYSDLLLSMATNQWQELDAREEVRSLVTDLNSNAGRQFSFSKDVVLKTALMVADVDVRFKVANFTRENMARVEAAWPQIKGALLRAASLLQQFGYNERNLTANSVIVPVAYYLYLRDAGDSYLDSTSDASDRLILQQWVTRSLIKRGVWGSGLDTLLTRIRDALRVSTPPGFPMAAVESAMAAVGKSLGFEAAEIDELLNLKYRGQRTFSVLSVLYPGLDLGKKFHEDHIFPKSRFTRKRLAAAGITAGKIDDYLEKVNLLPNLQLLAGTANIEKQDSLPPDWIARAFPTDEKRSTYLRENDLDGLSLELEDFQTFYDWRKARLRDRLLKALGNSAVANKAEGHG